MKPLERSLFPFLLNVLKPYSLYVAGLFFVAIFWASYISFSPYLVKNIIDVAQAYSHDSSEFIQEITWPCTYYVLAAWTFGLVFRFYDYVIIRLIPTLKNDIVEKAFRTVELNSYPFFQENFSGNISNKISDLALSVETIIAKGIDLFFSHSLATVIACCSLWLIHPVFALILSTWAIFSIAVSMVSAKKANIYAEQAADAHSVTIGKIVDSLTNIVNVKLFAREGYEARYLQRFLQLRLQKEQKHHWYLFFIKSVQNVAICSMIAFMLWLLVHERVQGNVTIGDFAFILMVTNSIIDAVWRLANELVHFSRDIGQARQALHLVAKPPSITDIPEASKLHVQQGEIVFDKVHFTYEKGKTIFSNKSITILPGQKIGLVGYSGSGKSTFVNLILRFYDVDSGAILIDGQDIAKVTQQSLRSQIALIPQDPLLFHRSLLENIRYGRLDATDEEVIEAAKRAHAHGFIQNLPEGYATMVGERGVKLSGGQRQRVAIARAILKNAPILILDEATSALDSITESYIQESFEWLMQGRTTIIIAHRLSTLSYMDRILVFDAGKIVEEGTQKELISKNGYFTNMWKMQAGGFLLDSK